MAKQKENTTKEQIRDQDALNDSLKSAVGILSEIRSLNKESLNIYADQFNLSKQLYQNANLIAIANKSIEHHSTVASNNYGIVAEKAKLIAEQTEIHRDLTEEISTTFADIVKNSESIADSEFEKVDLSKLQNKLIEERYNLELGREILGNREYEREFAILEVLQEKINAMKEMNDSQLRANELAQRFLGNTKLTGFAFNSMIGKIEHFVEEVGGEGLIGKFLGKKAADMLDHTKHDIQNKIVAAFQESGNAGVTAFSVTKIAAGSFIKYALPALGIAGLLGIFYGIIHAAGHLDAELAEIGKTFAVNRAEADKIHHIAIDLSKEMKLVGINSEELVDSLRTTANIMNGLSLVGPIKKGNEAAKQLVKDVSVLSSTFGLSGDEIANIQTLATITQKPIGQIVKETTKLGKGLLTSKQQVAILSKISPSISVAFKKGTQELIKAAQKAKLLGMELKDVQSFGDGILDFEQSLQNEMEARVLTGRNINFDLARQLALENDVAGLQDEMLKQLGSMNDFRKMNRIQQQSIAKAFGMEVDSVVELLAAQEKLNDLGIDQVKMDKIQAMNAQQLAEETKKTSNEKLKGYLVTLAKEREAASINDRIADAMKKIKEQLSASLAPLIEQVHHFLDSAEGAEFLKSVIEGIKTIVVGLGTTIKYIGTGISSMTKLFGGTGAAVGIILGLLGVMATYFVGKALLVKGIGLLTAKIVGASAATNTLAGSMKAVEAASSGLSGASKGVSGAGGFLSGMSGFAKNAVGIAAALVLFAGALWITSKAFQNFAQLDWAGVGKGVVAMIALTGVAAVLAVLGKFLLADGGATALALIGLGAALVLFSASLLIAAKGLEIMSKINWKGFDGAFTALAKVGYAFTIIGGMSPLIAIGAAALGLASMAVWSLSGAVNFLAKGLKSLETVGNMKGIALNIVDGFKELAKIPSMIRAAEVIKPLKEFLVSLQNVGFDKLIEFGKLAKVDMKNAGKNIADGINSLSQIKSNIDFGTSTNWMAGSLLGMFGVGTTKTGIKKTMDDFNDVIGELNLDNVKTLVEITKADMSKLGSKINQSINSLSEIQVGEDVKAKLLGVEDIFDLVEDVISELDIEELTAFAGIDANKLKNISLQMKDVVFNLSQIGKMGAPGMTALVGIFQKLSQAIDALNIDKLNSLANIKVDNLQKLRAVFQQPTGVGATTVSATTTAVETESSKANAKFDKMIALLEKMTGGGTANQPVNIVVKLGDRTLDVIATELYPRIERRSQERAINTGGRTTG